MGKKKTVIFEFTLNALPVMVDNPLYRPDVAITAPDYEPRQVRLQLIARSPYHAVIALYHACSEVQYCRYPEILVHMKWNHCVPKRFKDKRSRYSRYFRPGDINHYLLRDKVYRYAGKS